MSGSDRNDRTGMTASQAASNAMQVPDTLDLADRGRLAINGILGSLNPDLDFECAFLTIFDVHPPYMLHWSSMVSGVMPKYVEALPLLRQMTGSTEHMDLQDGFLRAMLKNMEEDGLPYDRVRRGAPGTPASATAPKTGTRTTPAPPAMRACWPA